MVKHTLVSDKESGEAINSLKRRASFEFNRDVSTPEIIKAILSVMDTDKVLGVLKENGQELGEKVEIENY